MSGGSYNYAYRAVLDMADDMPTRGTNDNALRTAFADHLRLVSVAMRAVEWVDSGDWGPEQEDQPIRAVLDRRSELAEGVRRLGAAAVELSSILDRVDQAARSGVLADVADERARQDAKWGVQDWPDGTGEAYLGPGHKTAESWGHDLELAARQQLGSSATFAAILAEEVGEALRESDPGKLEGELVQIAAVAVQWIEKLRRERLEAPR